MRTSVVVIIILFWINSSFSQQVINFSSDVNYKKYLDNHNLDLPFYPEKGFQDHSTKQLYFQHEFDFGFYEVLSFEFKEELVESTLNTSNSSYCDENYGIGFLIKKKIIKLKKYAVTFLY